MSAGTNPGLREEEIRPEHLLREQAERYAVDVRRLLGHAGEFVAVPCPACASAAAHQIYTKYELSYQVCDACGTMYVSPRPTPAILDDYYATSENYWYWNKYIFPASEDVRREKIFRPRAERIAEICRRVGIGGGTLLEVGAGFGTFCEEMQRLSFFRRIIAVEPSPELSETCRRKGLEVIAQPIEHVQFAPGTVDVVASFEVLEHLFSPREFLQSCASLLAPGGLLVLTCPSARGFDVVTLGARSDTVDAEHLNYFHPNSLAHLAESCGFDVLETFTPGKLDAEIVRKKVLGGECDLSGQPFLQQILIDEWERVGAVFQQFLADNKLSSHMWIVARKR